MCGGALAIDYNTVRIILMKKNILLLSFVLMGSVVFNEAAGTDDVTHNVVINAESIERALRGVGDGAGDAVIRASEGAAKAGSNLGKMLTNISEAFPTMGKDTLEAMRPIGGYLVKGLGVYVALMLTYKLGEVLGRKYIARYLFEPKLIDKKVSRWSLGRQKSINIRDRMVISDELAKDLNYIIKITQNIKKNGGFFEHVLLYGAPGTGKTLFAELLAESSGMNYALISAANVSQFLQKGTAVEELNNLFEWAAKSKNGTIIFFDEAEIFLANRGTLANEAQNALGAFLARTGTPSNKIMIICTTNRPEVIDPAVRSRLGLSVEFKAPDFKARVAQLKMHIKNVFDVQKGATVNATHLKNEKTVAEIARKLEGVSGRTIQKCVNRFRQMALALDKLVVDDQIIAEVIGQILKERA